MSTVLPHSEHGARHQRVHLYRSGGLLDCRITRLTSSALSRHLQHTPYSRGHHRLVQNMTIRAQSSDKYAAPAHSDIPKPKGYSKINASKFRRAHMREVSGSGKPRAQAGLGLRQVSGSGRKAGSVGRSRCTRAQSAASHEAQRTMKRSEPNTACQRRDIRGPAPDHESAHCSCAGCLARSRIWSLGLGH